MDEMPNDKMPSAFSHLETIGEVDTSQVVLSPSERRATQAREQLVGPVHGPTLAFVLTRENVHIPIQKRPQPAFGLIP